MQLRTLLAIGLSVLIATGVHAQNIVSGFANFNANYINFTGNITPFLTANFGTSQAVNAPTNAWPGRLMEMSAGTTSSPLTTPTGPLFKVSLTENYTTSCGGSFVDGSCNSAIVGWNVGGSTDQMQANGVLGESVCQTTLAVNLNCQGMQAIGIVTGPGVSTGIGISIVGKRQTPTGKVEGTEIDSDNFTSIPCGVSYGGAGTQCQGGAMFVPHGQTGGSFAANTITAASWASTLGGEITFTTNTAHGVVVGNLFTITGMTPSGYNGTFVAVNGTTGSTLVASTGLSYSNISNPGAASGFGALTASTAPAVIDHGAAIHIVNNSAADQGIWLEGVVCNNNTMVSWCFDDQSGGGIRTNGNINTAITPSSDVCTNASGTLVACANAGESKQTAATGLTVAQTSPALMMGIAASITTTASSTGRISVIFTGDMYSSAIGSGCQMKLSYGTGGAPANGAALTGTQIGGTIKFVADTTAGRTPYTVNYDITGLAASTAYWLDLAGNTVTGGTCTIENNSVTAHEIWP